MICLNCGKDQECDEIEIPDRKTYNDTVVGYFDCKECKHTNVVRFAPGYVIDTYETEEK